MCEFDDLVECAICAACCYCCLSLCKGGDSGRNQQPQHVVVTQQPGYPGPGGPMYYGAAGQQQPYGPPGAYPQGFPQGPQGYPSGPIQSQPYPPQYPPQPQGFPQPQGYPQPQGFPQGPGYPIQNQPPYPPPYAQQQMQQAAYNPSAPPKY